jgi:hypothetical protein
MKRHFRHQVFFESIIPSQEAQQEAEQLVEQQQDGAPPKNASVFAPKTGSYLESFKLKQT